MIFRYNFLTILWVLVIMGLTFTPGPNLPPLPHWDIISFDTFVHATMFAILVFLMSNSFKKSVSNIINRRPVLFSVIVSFIYGCFIELIQRYIPGRTFDYYDILSNTTGCVIGVIGIWMQHRFLSAASNSK